LTLLPHSITVFFSDEHVGRWIKPATTTHNRTLPGPPAFPEQNVDCTNDDCEADTRACHPGFACAPYEFGLEICKLQHKQAEKEWEKKYPNQPYDPNKLTDCKTALQPENGTNNKGFCIPCELGQYCPDGTITKGYSLFENRCPPGKLCRAPNVIEPCPGMFICLFFHFHIFFFFFFPVYKIIYEFILTSNFNISIFIYSFNQLVHFVRKQLFLKECSTEQYADLQVGLIICSWTLTQLPLNTYILTFHFLIQSSSLM